MSEVICWAIFLETVRNLAKMGVGMIPRQNFGPESDCICPSYPWGLGLGGGQSGEVGWCGFPSVLPPYLQATRPQNWLLLGPGPPSPCAYPPTPGRCRRPPLLPALLEVAAGVGDGEIHHVGSGVCSLFGYTKKRGQNSLKQYAWKWKWPKLCQWNWTYNWAIATVAELYVEKR